MDEHLEEIIKLAWKSSSVEAEYYLTKHIMKLQRRINLILDDMKYYDNDNFEDGTHYNSLLHVQKDLEDNLNKLKFTLSSLRGS